MPRRVERDITSLILATSPLKIRSWMSGEFNMISIAAMRPAPDSRGMRRCETSARMFSDRSISSCTRRSSGKKLMIRSSAWLALLACSVASIRCLSQGVFQGVVPRLGVDAHFAVRDHATFVGVHVLDGILDGNDVSPCLFIAVADHGSERRRLAGTG